MAFSWLIASGAPSRADIAFRELLKSLPLAGIIHEPVETQGHYLLHAELMNKSG